MIYNKHPFEKNGEISKENISNEALKFSSKLIVTEELKEVITSLLWKKACDRISISKVLSFPWFKFTDDQLKEKVKEMEAEEDRRRKRQEYLDRKAALRGNKFLNDNGDVEIMNRNLNKDIREDLL